jgi:hypothetical protein
LVNRAWEEEESRNVHWDANFSVASIALAIILSYSSQFSVILDMTANEGAEEGGRHLGEEKLAAAAFAMISATLSRRFGAGVGFGGVITESCAKGIKKTLGCFVVCTILWDGSPP